MSGMTRRGPAKGAALAEERIKKITSHLTLQGGRVVHAAGPFERLG